MRSSVVMSSPQDTAWLEIRALSPGAMGNGMRGQLIRREEESRGQVTFSRFAALNLLFYFHAVVHDFSRNGVFPRVKPCMGSFLRPDASGMTFAAGHLRQISDIHGVLERNSCFAAD